MLDLAPEYRPDPEQETPRFVEMVNSTMSRLQRTRQDMALTMQRLAQNLLSNCSGVKSAAIRLAPGNFTYEDRRISSSFLNHVRQSLMATLAVMPQFQMVQPAELQEAVKTRSIFVAPDVQPNSPDAIRSYVAADAVLLGEAWERGDHLLLRVKLVDSSQTTLSFADVMLAKSAIPANMPLRPDNLDSVKTAQPIINNVVPSASKLEIKLWTDRLDGGVYRVGETITVYVQANKACYLYLIYHDAVGADILAFPNPCRRNNYIEGNQRYEIPGPTGGFALNVAPPCGVEFLKAFASTQPLPELEFEVLDKCMVRLTRSTADWVETLRRLETERAEASCVITTLER
jgi:hypothetical protein